MIYCAYSQTYWDKVRKASISVIHHRQSPLVSTNQDNMFPGQELKLGSPRYEA
jgi:hypothetical protein